MGNPGPSVRLEVLREQELRLVTNLTKLRPLSRMAQRVPSLSLVAVMLSMPAGYSKGHKKKRRQLMRTVAEPTTHLLAPWGGGTII